MVSQLENCVIEFDEFIVFKKMLNDDSQNEFLTRKARQVFSRIVIHLGLFYKRK